MSSHAQNVLAQLKMAEEEGVISEEEYAEREAELANEDEDKPGPESVRIGRTD